MANLQFIPTLGENTTHHENLLGLHKSKEAVNQMSMKSSKTMPMVKRSFADISNRVGRNVNPKTDPMKKISSGKTKAEGTKSVSKYSSPFPEPDFRPEIIEVEDYEDILPDEYKLSNKDVGAFVKFWNSSKKNYDSCPPSPTPSLELISPLDYISEPEFELIPFEEDVGLFELPPPLW